MSTVQYFTSKTVGSAVLQELYSLLVQSSAFKTVLRHEVISSLLKIIILMI